MPPLPAGLLQWLLRRVSSRDAANAAIGDILEELDDRRAAGRAPRSAGLWVNLQTARAVTAMLRAATPRLMRSAGQLATDATRALRVAPAHALFVVLVIAAGVTAGTVTFSVVDAVVLKPLPLDQPEQLVGIATRDEDFTLRITPELFWRLHDELPSVQHMATRMTMYGDSVTVGRFTDEWAVTRATSEIFQLLRWSPAIGRLWTADDERRGETDVAVLGHRFWQERFGASPSVLAETVTIGRRTYRVIGVLPASSDHPELDLTSTPIWIPAIMPRVGEAGPFGIIARMQPGVSTAQLTDDIRRLAGIRGWNPDVTPLLQGYVAPVRRWMLLALGAAALVVLIACVNAANLMLTRFARRSHEMAVRASLGASRRQIAAAVLAEGILLSLAATACALFSSFVGIRVAKVAILTMLPGMFRAATIAVNGRVLAAAIVAGAVTGILVSLVPAWQMSRSPVSSLLKDTNAITSSVRRGWRGLFLTTEIAAVSVLLVVSWLFVASLVRVVSVDLGIDLANLVAVEPRLAFRGTVDDVQRRLETLPGVSGIAVSTGASLPLVGRAFGGAWITTTLRRADGSASNGADSPLKTLLQRVTPNYFDVAGLRFTRGGTWSVEAVASAPAVVLDDEAARLLFGEDDPLGKQVRATKPDGVFTVVGIVPHVYSRGPEEPHLPAAYFHLPANPARVFADLFVRVSRPPEQMMAVVTEALRDVAPRNKDPYVFVADQAVSKITATRRFNAAFMSAFGLAAILIGAAGVYAVMGSFVAQQTREIGVRVALGATPARIRREVLALACRYLLAGLTIGLPIAWWLSRGFAALLFQVTPADTSVYVGVASLLGAGAMMAAWIPAHRASRVDPVLSLRR